MTLVHAIAATARERVNAIISDRMRHRAEEARLSRQPLPFSETVITVDGETTVVGGCGEVRFG